MRQLLEKYQVLIYLLAILCGLTAGAMFPAIGILLEALLWPTLGLLLYTTFTQVPLSPLRKAFVDSRFLAAAVVGNFLVLPAVVWALVSVLPDDPAIRLGVLMVLLVPCTDWFIVFTQLGGGDTKRAIAFSPISLLLQLLLLPLYLSVFLGAEFAITLASTELLVAFGGLILIPLLAAFLTEKWVTGNEERNSVLERIAWFPIPLLTAVVFIIAASQVSIVLSASAWLGHLLLVFVGFLAIAGVMARLLAGLFKLPSTQGRVLAFSFGTRNSFVVLPLALALPALFELVAVVIVLQSLIELFGMVIYLWWVPNRLFPEKS